MRWHELTPVERIKAIQLRFHKRRNLKPLPKHVNVNQWPQRLSKARARRARLELERSHWEHFVSQYSGNVTEIAWRIGTSTKTARIALWDLGLWPDVIRARASVPIDK